MICTFVGEIGYLGTHDFKVCCDMEANLHHVQFVFVIRVRTPGFETG